MSNKFNPEDWLSEEKKEGKPARAPEGARGTPGTRENVQAHDNALAVEKALEALEVSGTDITRLYKDWVEIGFAFTDCFGEAGREYFHRVSQFHPEYDRKACDRQYDYCLHSKGSGIRIGSFFHHVKGAGIALKPSPFPEPPRRLTDEHWDSHEAPRSFEEPLPERLLEERRSVAGTAASYGSRDRGRSAETRELEEVDTSNLPSLPEELFQKLPALLQQAIAPAKGVEERDLLLLGSIASLSACLPMVSSRYHGRKVGTNLYLYVTAPASAGKGRLNLCKRLVLPLHRHLREESKLLKQEYELAVAAYTSGQTSEKPLKPSEKMLLIPANNSATGLYELLGASQGNGLIFETEGDTMAESLKTDYGNYSYGLRQAFHHETIAFYRRTDKEHVEIESPHLSVVLSGTPYQVNGLIHNAENGLFSRFLFYYMDLKPVWADVFGEDSDYGPEEHFDNLGAEFFSFHRRLEQHGELKILFTAEQAEKFNLLFSNILTRYSALEGADAAAIIFRMGLICFRIAMVLSTLRLMDQREIPQKLYCSEADFEAAVSMMLMLLEHSNFVYHWLPETPGIKVRTSRNQRFLDALPESFGRAEYLRVAAQQKIPAKTAEKYIYSFVDAELLEREVQGLYIRKNRKFFEVNQLQLVEEA